MGVTAALFGEERRGHLVGRYPGWRVTFIAFPGALFQAAPSGWNDESGIP
jgi:hypothetical protein